MTGKQHVKILEAMKEKRRPFEPLWQSAYDNTFPILGQNITDNMSIDIMGNSKTKTAEIYDATLKDACRLLASSLTSGTTPANSLWFGNELYGEAPGSAGQKYLDKASEVIWKNIHNCNFDDISYLLMLHFVLAGQFCLYIKEGDLEKGQLYDFVLWHLRSCYFASSKGNGENDTVYRVFSLTAAQAVNSYTRRTDKVPQKIQEDAIKKPNEVYWFCQAVYPRTNPKKHEHPIASETFSLATKTIIRKSGYEEMPCIIPRWLQVSDSAYCLGPADDALPDHKTLNKAKELVFDNAEMAIAGMWGMVDDGTLNPKTVVVGARRIVVVGNKDSIFPLKPGGDFNLAHLEVNTLQKQIRRIMMSDQLHPEDGPAMTAYETSVKVRRIREILGPMYVGLQSGYLKPFVGRCFGIAYRKGIIGEPPKEIENSLSKIKFLSPMAKAQKLEDISAMDRFEDRLLQKAEAKPDIIDIYDMDKAGKKRAELEGVPGELLNDEDEIKDIRKKRVEARQAAMEQEKKDQMQKDIVKGKASVRQQAS
ncbi:MAG TPA: phage tail protein [Nitrospirae bacterium]|nr:phage tail protein [Nitrospirota bacterium]